MLILIDSLYIDNEFDEKFFSSLINNISKFIEFNLAAELSIVLTDDTSIAELNAQYRGKSRPTDVLSFPMDDDIRLGDIVISLDTARKQAEEVDIPLKREVAFIFIHGFLHLMGFDHEDKNGNEAPEDAEEMFSLQEEILAAWVNEYE